MNKKQLEIIDQHRKLLDSLRATTNNNVAHQCYGFAAAEFKRFVNELDAADSKCHHGKASTEESERIVAIHKSLADLWSDFRKSEAGRRSLASDTLSGLADVRDECEKLRTNERQITEYVNKIRADLDAITTDKTCVVVLGQCVSELRNTLTNAQLAGQLEVNKINERLAKLEEYCHTHYVDATGACCPGEPVVVVKPVKAEEAATPVRVDDGAEPITQRWLLACGFTETVSEFCVKYWQSPHVNGNYLTVRMLYKTDGTEKWEYLSPMGLANFVHELKTRSDMRELAATCLCPFVEPDPSTTSP